MSKNQVVTQFQNFNWVLPIFLMFNYIFGENGNKTVLNSKPVKTDRVIQKPTESDLQVLAERLAEVMVLPINNQQFKKGTNSSLPQSPTGLKNNPINLTRQIKKAEFKSKFNVSWNKTNETPVFIKGSELSEFSSQFTGSHSAQEIAKEFISLHKDVFQLENPNSELVTLREFTDRYGKKHVKFQQVFEGIPVWGKTVISHFEPEGELYLINARFSPSPKELDVTQINFSLDQAIQITLDDISTFTDVMEFNDEMKALLSYNSPVGKQYIWINPETEVPHLIWHVQVRPNSRDNWYYFIDAINGQILEKYNNTQTDGPAQGSAIDLNGEQQTVHSYAVGNTYYMVDASSEIWQYWNYSEDPVGALMTLKYNPFSYITSLDVDGWEPVQVSAHSNTGSVFQYFYDTFNREAIDGYGSTIISVVNVTKDGAPMDNAYWNGVFMAYGDGAIYFEPFAKALDVAAHEMTHGIVEHTVNLEYKFESGALNESFADIFAAMVDRDDWEIGEDIVNPLYFGDRPLRDLSDPNLGGTSADWYWQPAHMNEFLDYPITNDNGGVHYNSGIPNKACYLIAEVIGREYTEQIYYRILEAGYLTPQATFVDMRLAAIQAAGELYGDDEVAAVTSAFDAVGIYDGVGTTLPSDTEPVQGEDWIVAINDENGDHSLVLIHPETGEKTLLTETQVSTEYSNTISVDASGTKIFFIDESNNLVQIDPDGTDEENLTSSNPTLNGLMRQISIAPDNNKYVATLYNNPAGGLYFDTYLLLVSSNGVTFIELCSPTLTQGICTDDIKGIDAMSWDPNSEILIYDAFNSIELENGSTNDYWNINKIYIQTYIESDTVIISNFMQQTEGYHLTNPSYARTNSNYIAFDYGTIVDDFTYVWSYVYDSYNNELVEIYDNLNIWSRPSYSPGDDYLIVQTSESGANVAKKIFMENQATKTDIIEIIAEDILSPIWFVIEGEMSIEENSQYPEIFSLNQNHPNPFNPVTQIDFEIPFDTQVSLSIVDISGRKIKTLENSRLNAGNHSVRWDGTNHFGKTVSAGIYLFRLQTDQFSETRKMIYLK